MSQSEDADSTGRRNKLRSLETIDMSHSGPDYVDEFHSNSFMFDDDEVFEQFQESSSMTVTRGPRVRRISDVIDSIGCSPSSPVNKASGTFDFSERALNSTETEERSITIIRREEMKYINLSSPPAGRAKAMNSVPDGMSLVSPPITPSSLQSDQGYCSAGLPTPPSTLVFRPKWFRYSASSLDSNVGSPPRNDVVDALHTHSALLPPAHSHSRSQSHDSQVDAQIMCAPVEEKSNTMEATTISPSNELGEGKGVTPLQYTKCQMPVVKNSLEYNMSHPRTGHALIFNHEEFTMDNTPPRVGSKLDAIRLQSALEALGFTVAVYHDLDSEKIKARINELASLDHTECDCVLVVVLSHGMGTSYILSHDYPYPVDMLWSPFIPDRCPTLAGKPKLFMIQACRGDKLDGGVQLVKSTQVDSDSGSQTYKIPAMADFLLAYSTTEGFYSWRNPLKGTWFIQSLCEILEHSAFSQDLATLLLMVSHKVALDHESFSDLYPWQHQQKQVPQTVSTLIRKVFFQKKP